MKKNLLFVMTLVVSICIQAQVVSTTRPEGIKKEARAFSPGVELSRQKISATSLVERQVAAKHVVREVISSRKIKDGSQYQIVKMKDGTVKKQIKFSQKLSDRISIQKDNSSGSNKTIAADNDRFYEGFEEWDGETPDWIPNGWTDESKAGSPSNVTNIYGDLMNFTWKTTDGLFVLPSEGRYCGSVQFAYAYEIFGAGGIGDTVNVDPSPSDEWLISPPMDIQANDSLMLDLYYDPFFGRVNNEKLLNEGEWAFDATNTIVEVLVSSDGGANWTKEWDNLEKMLSYSEDELWQIAYSEPQWTKIVLPLYKKYAGKTVKVAIRYQDDNGESVYVDYFRSIPNPQATYIYPEGYLISGLTSDYYSLNANILRGNAYAPAQWLAQTNDDAESIVWNFDGIGELTDKDPAVSYPLAIVNAPIITAKNGSVESVWQWGTEDQDNILFTGGHINDVIEDANYGAGNYDMNYAIAYASDMNADSYASYGLGTFVGVANYFEKPAAKFMFETFNVHCGNIIAKQGEPVKLLIRKVDGEGKFTDTIAVSEAYPGDFILAQSGDGIDYYTIPFKFKALDPETGREEDTWVEIEDAFFVEVYNYESALMFLQREDHLSDVRGNYAYVTVDDEDGRNIYSVNSLYSWNTSFLFDMDATFPFLYTEDNRYAAPAEGGSKTFEITSYFLPVNSLGESQWWTENDMPDWIQFGDIIYDENTGVASLPVTVSALPNDISGRNADIKIASYGCNLTLQFKQGDGWFTGISNIKSTAFKAVQQGDAFLLSYPEGTTSVTIYGISGRKMATYPLNTGVASSISAANLSAGVYILQFTGKTNGVVKVLKKN